MRTFLVVEGHGEQAAAPVLIRRVAAASGGRLELVGRPWREPRSRLCAEDHLARVLEAARLVADAVLIMLDTDDDCAVELAATIRRVAASVAPGFPVRVVCAVREYEAWFLAAAESLRGKRGLPPDLQRPEEPEQIRDAKGWLSERMAQRYSPTLDQPALSALIDTTECAVYSRSFRKLVSEVTALAGAP